MLNFISNIMQLYEIISSLLTFVKRIVTSSLLNPNSEPLKTKGQSNSISVNFSISTFFPSFDKFVFILVIIVWNICPESFLIV